MFFYVKKKKLILEFAVKYKNKNKFIDHSMIIYRALDKFEKVKRCSKCSKL